VLAGGGARRFGRNKLVEPYRGAPLVHHVIRRLDEVCDGVVIVLAPDAADPGAPAGIDVDIARDATSGEGPLAGLAAGLAATTTEWAVVAGGDMPELSEAVLAEMLRVAGEGSADAVALVDEGVVRPLPLVVRTAAALGSARALLDAGGRSLRALLEALRLHVVDEPIWHALDPTRGTLRDVDVPGDLDP
jgi:molybdenum cofactor guanylyltransferase